MPDRDYATFLGDSTSTKPDRDYSKVVGKGGAKVPIQAVPEHLAQPSPEQQRGIARDMLGALGHDPEAIEGVMNPPGIQAQTMDYSTLFQNAPASSTATILATEESWKIDQQQREDGAPLSVDEREGIAKFFEPLKKHVVTPLAESRRWWDGMMESVADRVTDTFSGGITELNLGLSMLDVASRYVNAGVPIDAVRNLALKPGELTGLPSFFVFPPSMLLAGRLSLLPPDQVDDVKARVLPKITLRQLGGDPKEFSNGTTAALWLHSQRALGLLEREAGGNVARNLVPAERMLGLHTLADATADIATRTRKRGERRQQFVQGSVPQLSGAIPEPLMIQEIVERSWAPNIDLDSVALGIQSLPHIPGQPFSGGTMILGQIAGGTALGELVIDPLMWAGGISTSLPKLVPALVRKFAPGKAATITAQIARYTMRLDDVVDANKASANLIETVDKKIKQAVDAGGGVPADLYRKKLAAEKAHIANRQLLSNFEDPGPHEIIMRRAPRLNPDYIPDPPLSATEIERELHVFRKKVAAGEADINLRWEQIMEDAISAKRGQEAATASDWPLFQQRVILGADDSEVAGDGLNRLIRGASIDDITVTPVAPEYRIMPDIKQPLIGWDTAETLKAEQALVSKMQGKQYDLFSSSQRVLSRSEDIVRRNLGEARKVADKPLITLFEDQLAGIRRQQEMLGKGLSKEAQVYDDIWLPKSGPGIMEDPGRFNSWLKTANDRVLRSLYPGGLFINGWNTGVGRLIGQARDPQRFYQAYAPEMWDEIRGTYAKYSNMLAAWNNRTRQGMEDAGVLVARSDFNPKKHMAPYTVSAKKSEQLFDLLNTVPGTEKWDELAKGASPQMIRAHNSIRKALNQAADAQGISDLPAVDGGALTGYIHHFLDRSQFAGGARPLEYIGMPANAEAFVGHLLPRKGGGGSFPKEVTSILDLYGRSMYRKMLLEPMFDKILVHGKKMAGETGSPMFQSFANDFVNHLKGKPAFAGKMIDDWVGGALNAEGRTLWQPDKIDRTLAGLSSLFYAGTLVGNPRYPLMQIATGIATTTGRYGMLRTMRGLFQMATKEGQAIAKQAGVYEPFRAIFDTKAGKMAGELMSKVPVVSPFGVMTNAQAEFAVRGLTFHAAVDEHLTRMGFSSLSAALRAGFGKRIVYEGLRSSEEVNHMFGALGRNPRVSQGLGRGMVASATQFLSFTWKQTDELLSQSSRSPGHLMTYLATSGWMARIAAQEFGIDVTNYVGLGYLPQEPDDLTSPGADFLLTSMQLAGAITDGDPEKVHRKAKEFENSVATILVPGLAAYHSASRSAKRVADGKVTRVGGDKIRDINFKEGLAPGLGSDLIPTAFGQQNINDRLMDVSMQALRKQRRQFYFNLKRTVEDFIDAVEAGNTARQDELVETLTDVYRVRLSGIGAIEREMGARHLDEMLRFIQEDPLLLDVYIKTLQENGLGFDEPADQRALEPPERTIPFE